LWQQVNTGTAAVLDDRILMKQHSRAFLDALPKYPVEVV
jgi:Rad3-related DNA helicase